MTLSASKKMTIATQWFKHPKFPMLAGTGTALFVGIGVYASPYLTLNSMKGAIDRGDSAAIAQNVDFPALRSSIKSEMQASINRQAASRDPMASMGALMAGSLIDPMIDRIVTPEGLTELMKHSKSSNSNAGSSSASKTAQEDGQVTMGYESFNSFVVKLEGKNLNLPNQFGSASPSLVFSRSGFGWKLTGVRM